MNFFENLKNIVSNYAKTSLGVIKFGINHAIKIFKERYIINSLISNERLCILVSTKDGVSHYVTPISYDKRSNMIGKTVYGIIKSELEEDLKIDITQEPGTPYKFRPEELGFDHYLIVDTIINTCEIVTVAPEYLE